jgi:hypothetical protein
MGAAAKSLPITEHQLVGSKYHLLRSRWHLRVVFISFCRDWTCLMMKQDATVGLNNCAIQLTEIRNPTYDVINVYHPHRNIVTIV